jgi:hypothetical protein
LFALGTRTIADLTLHPVPKCGETSLQLGAHYVRVLAVTG